MGAFWLRALTLMRRRVIDSAEALEQLAETVAELRNDMNVIRERIDLAGRRSAGPLDDSRFEITDSRVQI